MTSPYSLSASHRRIPPPCWSQEETSALIDAYCKKWYSLQRGNLRATHWEEVSNDVADRCHVSSSGNPRKTSIQCRHKMEKLKKRYRGEVSRAAVRKGETYLSSWVHFKQMDFMEKGLLYSDPVLDPVGHHPVQDDDEEDEEANENEFRVKFPSWVSDHPLVNMKQGYGSGDGGVGIADYRLLNVKQGYGSGKGLRNDYDKSMIVENRSGSGNGDDPAVELVAAIKRLGDVYIRTEKMRMDTVKEVELMRMEIEMKRTQTILEMRERLVDSFSNAGLEKKNKKIKRMPTQEC